MKRRLGAEEVGGVGVMKDEELQFEEIEASYRLGGAHTTLIQKHTLQPSSLLVVYYEEIKRELNRILIYE